MAYTRLSVHDREEISRFLAADPLTSWSAMSRSVSRHRSTIEREVTRNGGRDAYRAAAAGKRAAGRRAQRPAKLVADPALAERVSVHLRRGYSPAGCAHLVSGIATETIYQAIYSGLLGLKASQVLRTRRHRRRRRDVRAQTACHYLGEFTPIHQRPAVVNERGEFGHWEGDLIIGARNKSALITLVERVSRVQHVLALPDGHRAELTCGRLAQWAKTTPHSELRSITWDRGSEMADWQSVNLEWGVEFYFADAHSPWQRGQNENGNRQLRFWLPKGTDLRAHTQADLDRITDVLNTQPRRLHSWRTPNAVYAQHTAH